LFERFLGKRKLFHAKYNYSGIPTEVEGKWTLLDDCWMHFACDSKVRVRRSDNPPIYLGDGVLLNLDYVESVPPNVEWFAEEEELSPKKANRRTT
jgi:hypothetical protein